MCVEDTISFCTMYVMNKKDLFDKIFRRAVTCTECCVDLHNYNE